MNMLMLLFPLLLLIIIFWGARFSGFTETAPSYLCPAQTRYIQSAAILAIILHHLTQQVTSYGLYPKGLLTIFNYTGYPCTALFFFFSGYGLITSLQTKPDYLKTFPKKRFLSVLIPFWAVNLLIVMSEKYIYGVHLTAAKTLRYIFGLSLLNGNGWFFIEIVLFYVLFYALFSLIPHRDAALFLLCAFTVLFIVFSSRLGYETGTKTAWFKGEWWHNSTIAFIPGLLYARFRTPADRFIRKHYLLLLPVFGILSAVTFRSAVYAERHGGYHHYAGYSQRHYALLTLRAQMTAAVCFVILILLLNMRVTIGNRILRYLSGIRTELLLIHPWFVARVFKNIRMNDFTRYSAVIVCSLACSALISPFIRLAVGKTAALLTRTRVINDTLESAARERRREKKLKRLRTAVSIGAILLLLLVPILYAGKMLYSKAEHSRELAAVRQAKTGDTIFWGHYNTDSFPLTKERLSWIVIHREKDKVCLLSEKGIAGSSYNRKHEEVTWEESDLRALLNTDAFTSIFSRYEASSMIADGKDKLTLLRPEEARQYFPADQDRELVITTAARLHGTNINQMSKDNLWDMKGYRSSWWWLRGPSDWKSIYAPIVTVDGEILTEKKTVNKPGGAVRPVIWIRTGE